MLKTFFASLLIVFASELVIAQSSSIHAMHRPSYRTNMMPRSEGKRYITSKTEPYRLDSGDVLGVIVDGVIGEFSSAHVTFPTKGNGILPSIGHPVPLLGDGTVVLPYIKTLSLRGFTISQAQQRIIDAYRNEKILEQPHRVYVTLMRKRTVDVTVFRDDAQGRNIGASRVRLESDQATPLAATAKSGSFDTRGTVSVWNTRQRGTALGDNSIVLNRSINAGTYFVLGGSRGGAYSLPSDRSLTVLEALLAAGVTNISTIGGNRVTVARRTGGSIALDGHRLYQDASRMRVGPGDTIMVAH